VSAGARRERAGADECGSPVKPQPAGTVAASAPGLAADEAAARFERHGANEIARREATPRWRVLLAQLTSPLVLILVGAAVVSALVGAHSDAIAITVIVGVNALIGYVQESRAEQAILALRSLTAARATVVRDGAAKVIAAREVVPGDVLLLEPGDVVAADGRVHEASSLTLIEAVLTGESLPVEKSREPVAPEAPIAERHDRVFMGTTVATGTARVEVTDTAMTTELGRIAHLLAQPDTSATPLQRRLAVLGKVLLYVTVALVGVVALLGWLRGLPWLDLLLISVSLAVSAVPEGLPAVLTVAMALGVRRLAAHRVLVRRLSAVETLGCATVVCTDKTGTLTTGVMALREHWGPKHELLLAASACCDAELQGEGGVGDPTELAILRAAAELGIVRADIERDHPRVRTLPFDTERRRMSVWRADGRCYVKGALESLRPLCASMPEGVTDAADELARDGLRVLAIATGTSTDERELELLGLVGIADAPREEARAAIAAARAAGVHIVMITGDHPLTAEAIARELGIVAQGESVEQRVYARKTAADKTAIVAKLRAAGEIVGMTGDGVNDAPSIREADVGIAMGQAATEVTREAADMILTADDLGGVVAAIREGRIVYDNIRKTVIYLLAGNASGLAMMLFAAAVGWPLPLMPLQLLWLNIMCEPLPGIALAIDPADDDVMRRPPRDPRAPLLDGVAWRHIAWVSLLQAAVAMGAYAWGHQRGELEMARTLAFATLVFGVLLRSFAARSPDKLLWEVGWARNLPLLAVVSFSVLLQITLHTVPLLREWLGLAELTVMELGAALALGFVPVTVVELAKLVARRRRTRAHSG
jgi:P-type Ca2+ transporter type 2C